MSAAISTRARDLARERQTRKRLRDAARRAVRKPAARFAVAKGGFSMLKGRV